MTPLLLTLAGMLPGDGGGAGGGAARAPVAVKLGQGCKGFLRLSDGPLCPVRLREGEVWVERPWGSASFFPASLTLGAEGRFLRAADPTHGQRAERGPPAGLGAGRNKRGRGTLTSPGPAAPLSRRPPSQETACQPAGHSV